MPVARPEPLDTRVIAHVDLDCFYVQVEQRRHPELKGKPTAVVQYNPYRGGAIIAVGYEARRAGVTRNMRGYDARKICPNIALVQVPVAHGKADLSVYRDAGSEVVQVFSRMGICERASIDEVYLDITDAAVKLLAECPPSTSRVHSEEVLKSHIIGVATDSGGDSVRDWLSRSYASRSDQLLACGAIIVADLRDAVVSETGFTTSAGVAHNKMLAKIASGMHKPAQQTVVPSSEVQTFLAQLPIKKIKYLGGKLGVRLGTDLGVTHVGDLLPYKESKLQDMYGFNTGTWLWRVARGMNGDEVEGRTLPKSHGCGKTFPGPTALKDLDSVRYWLTELSAELQERLDEDFKLNNRKARLLVVHASCHRDRETNSNKTFSSKSCILRYGKERIATDAVQLFRRSLAEFCPDLPKLSPLKGDSAAKTSTYSSLPQWAVTGLSVGANNIYDVPAGTGSITHFFGSPTAALGKDSATSPLQSPLQREESSHRRDAVEVEKEEEVISLNDPEDKILNFDASSFNPHLEEGEHNGLELSGDTFNDDGDEASFGTELDAPVSPNSLSALSRREWSSSTRKSTQSKRERKDHLPQPLNSQANLADCRSYGFKQVKRNLMTSLPPRTCDCDGAASTPRFGDVSCCCFSAPAFDLPKAEYDHAAAEGQPESKRCDPSESLYVISSPYEAGLAQTCASGLDSARGSQVFSEVELHVSESKFQLKQFRRNSNHEPLLPRTPIAGREVDVPLTNTTVKEAFANESLDWADATGQPEESTISYLAPEPTADGKSGIQQSADLDISDPGLGTDRKVSAGSSRWQGGAFSGQNPSSLTSSGRKRVVFKRVDELWDKWKSSDTSSTSGTRDISSKDGRTLDEFRNGQNALQPQSESQLGRKRKVSISDFFVKSPMKGE